jgi:transcription-repair coupling factor (superfamily II helicase)
MAFRSSRYGWLILAGILIVPVGITRYSDWKREQAEMERMKDPAYAEAKRKEQAEWEKTRSAMKTLETQRASSRSIPGIVVSMADYQAIFIRG